MHRTSPVRTRRRMVIETSVRGAGTVTADIKDGRTRGGMDYANFLVRTDDGNIVRIQFWGYTRESIEALFPAGCERGARVGFHGYLRGTYDEKPTITCRPEDIRTGKD